MSGQLSGRIAIVTGAGEGIGAAIARRFATEGATVVVAEIRDDLGASLVAELRAADHDAMFVATDVGRRTDNEAMVAATLERYGRIDILVNNAWGGGTISRVEHKTDADVDHGLAVGFRGPLWAMQAVYPSMRAAGYGRIVNLCSLNGVNAHVGTLEYNAAKEALRAASRTVAREWAATGIVCNVICPGAKSASFLRVMGEHPELLAAADASNPMGRIGDPYDDIAPVALFLASEGCRYLTGNTLFVDGGSHINGVAWAPDIGPP